MPMSNDEFEAWCQRNAIPNNGKKYISRVRDNPPARLVGGHGKNASGNYPSRRSGFTQQFESRTVELPAIYIYYEYADDLIEYYTQAEAIPIIYFFKSGSRTYTHTPDCLVLSETGGFLDQWKTADEAIKLSQKHPDRYGQDKEGNWHFYPGEEAARDLGLIFRLRLSSEINPTLYRNLQFLEDYFQKAQSATSQANELTILAAVESAPGITILELLSRFSGQISSDEIYSMIARGKIYVDLKSFLLAEPKYAKVFRNAEMASALNIVESEPPSPKVNIRPVVLEPGEQILWNGVLWTIINVGTPNISLQQKDKKLLDLDREIFNAYVGKGIIKGLLPIASGPRDHAMERLRKASTNDLKEAHRRYTIILPRIRTDMDRQCNIPERTERNYWSLYLDGERKYCSGFVGLLPNHNNKGKRINDPTQKQYLTKDAIEDWMLDKKKGLLSVLRALNYRLSDEGLPTMSINTFRKRIRDSVSKFVGTLSREGERAGYAVEDIDWSLSEIPTHGDWPWHIVHIDHTVIDLELISEDGRNLGRLWLTLMVDAKTRRILAISINFDPPSYRSLMNIMRECVRRHGRLPHSVVVDNGADLRSIYFDSLLAQFSIIKIVRPPTMPRFGTVVERLIGTINTTFLYNLFGNTQASKKVRQMTKAVNPKINAVWTPERFHKRLQEWAYEIYDTVNHSGLQGMSPREVYENSIVLTGERKHLIIPYDLEFIMSTYPSTKKGTAKVTRLGVKINNIWYSCTAFKMAGVRERDVNVRYDPYDASIAFAYVNGEWKRCISKYEVQFRGKTERNIQMRTDELRSSNKGRGVSFTVSDAILAKFIQECETEEIELSALKKAREKENCKLLDTLELKSLLPQEVPVSEETEPRVPETATEKSKEIYKELEA